MGTEVQFHVGIVVDDFEAALADLSSMFGYEWPGELGGPIQVRLPNGASLLSVPLFAFYRRVTGFRAEQVSRIVQPGLELQWAGRSQSA